jgi:hypothetical protein
VLEVRIADRDDSWLDPRSDAAKIRAFFVDPQVARRGLGRAILERSEGEAVRAGFSSFALMATLPGVPFYERCGYVAGAPRQPSVARRARHPLRADAQAPGGTSAASRAMKSKGSSAMCFVPSRYGVFASAPVARHLYGWAAAGRCE